MKSLAQFDVHWPAISELLDEALQLPAAARAEWLESLIGPRAEHREVLIALLATQASVETDDFLAELPRLPSGSTQATGRHAIHASEGGLAAGGLVGPYRLIEEIGRGGMGTVWLAERADGLVSRRVALKLPRAVWGDALAERFARERDILSTLTHEHIGRLYDVGIDSIGRPYLAMEFVEGEAIDAYCRTHELPLRERIALLLQVMAAVAHAHARLVVHRDLKPSNILVTKEGQVRLLDFGIAKLLEDERTRETALTELGGRALTLDYASPEQIRGEPLGTASDVYSMAVVAYEVLAGSRPYRLKRASAAELEEAIATIESPNASASATDPRVARQLRGDLDAILNKALKKTPGERYPTMEAFAQDLRRYLAGEPVEARPDGLAYRTGKFVRRYRLQVAASALVSLALVAGASVALWQAHEAQLAAGRAQSEAATAKAVQGFIESVFNANSGNQADPISARATTARELLDRGADRIDKELASAPEAQLRLYDLLAGMYAQMALYERTLVLARRGLALATRLHGKDSDAALDMATGVAQTLQATGRGDEALAMLLEMDAVARTRHNDRDQIRMHIDAILALGYLNSDPPKALERARSAAAIARSKGPSQDGVTVLYTLGEAARMSGHLKEAQDALVEAVAWTDQKLNGASAQLPDVLAVLGEVQSQLGQPGLAGADLARALSILERLGDPESLHVCRLKLARYQYENGLFRQALDTGNADYAWARGLLDKKESGRVPARVTLQYAQTLVAHGDAALGLAVLDTLIAAKPHVTMDWNAQLWAAHADALISLHRPGEAVADVERAISMLSDGGDRRIAQSVHATRRRYWVAVGKVEEALQDFAASPPRVDETTTAYTVLRRQDEEATLLLAAGHNNEARTTAAGALATIDRLPDRRFTRDVEARMTAVLGQALLREDRVAEALPVLQTALALHLTEYDPTHSPAIAKVRLALAEAQRRAEQVAESR
ncbi:MAG: serine/threonine-protein kinase [Caldimonas sp.]